MKNILLTKNELIKINFILLFLTILLIAFSCKNKNDTNKSKVNVKKNIPIEKKTKEVLNNLNNEAKITPKKNEKDQTLINKKLVGLSIKNKKETNVYKKYWIDFYSTCMWQAPSFYIDDENKKLYIFNYSEKKFKTINNEDIWVMFNIEKIDFENENLSIKVRNTTEYKTNC